ncbi:MAG: cell division protein FtsA [bacterium]|nr:cell division protein FtsA [bacterium]
MRKHTAVGIDIGTQDIKVVVASSDGTGERALPKIIGTSTVESKGVRHGYVVNISETAKSLRIAIAQAERASGVKIRKAFVSIGGVSLQSVSTLGSVIISRGDSEVSELDLDKATAAAERNLSTSQTSNRRIIHTIPLSYRIDGKPVFGRPQGMKGNKLEAKVLFITCLTQHLEDLIETCDEAGVEVLDVTAAPIAASLVLLSKNQKVAGCVLADMGSETTSIVVYENNLPISLEVFPIGSTDVTNDIALGLKIPIEDAEGVKRGGPAAAQFSKKKLDDIMGARLYDIFELIEEHLKKIDRNGLLPAGIILSGGGSGISGIDGLAKESLGLPSRVILARDSAISVAYGLGMLGLGTEEANDVHGVRRGTSMLAKPLAWLRQLLP